MTADNYVSEILVVADGNPQSGRRTFQLHAAVGQGGSLDAHSAATTQNIIVVAKTSDGKFYHRPEAGEGHHRRLRRLIRQQNQEFRRDIMAEKPRLKLPKEAKKGEVIEIKTLLPHIMESGQRKDEDGKTIPRKIINKFTCEFNGKPVFTADLEPAIAANPYHAVHAKVDESGTFKFTWTDDDGTVTTAEETITVT